MGAQVIEEIRLAAKSTVHMIDCKVEGMGGYTVELELHTQNRDTHIALCVT